MHGLLATGVLALVGRLGVVYDDAEVWAQHAIRWSLALALLIAVASIGCLLRAVAPYKPRELHERIKEHYTQAAFPDIEKLMDRARFDRTLGRVRPTLPRTRAYWRYKLTGRARNAGPDEFRQFEDEVKGLGDTKPIEAEYEAELVKLAEILDHEARWASLGFGLLFAEVVAVAVFLLTVGAVGAHVPWVSTTRPPTLRWLAVEANGARHKLHGSGRVDVRLPGDVRILLLVRDESGLNRARVRLEPRYDCAGPDGRTITMPGPPQRSRRFEGVKAGRLASTARLRRHSCPEGTRFDRAVVRATARASDSRGFESRARLRLVAAP